ncbi:MAG: TIGR02757 family protein [Treponema sp.]|nr:TIGR02757 family protein [Treponema sp.]
MKDVSLLKELEKSYRIICKPGFIALDPVQFPHRYKKREDIEISAFLAATIAWGRRDMILRSAHKMFTIMGTSLYDFIMKDGYNKLKKNNIHRTFFESDLKYFCKGFKRIYSMYGSIENLFLNVNVWEGFRIFREEMANANKKIYSRHIADPGIENKNGSACKKLNLALRWLVREGPVDLRLWKNIKPSALYIPLDVHVARTARKLGLLERKSNDKKSVILLTEKLREFDLSDPVKYDFALFGMSALNQDRE